MKLSQPKCCVSARPVRLLGGQVFTKGLVTDHPLTIRHKDGRLAEVQREYYVTLKWEP